MSAPNEAFLTPKLNTYNSVLTQHYRAILTDSKEILKERFYLDDLLITKDGSGDNGFVGLVKVDGDNYQFHHPIRIGTIKLYNSGVQTTYTDAGLNTLANISTPQPVLEGTGLQTILTPAYYVVPSIIYLYSKNTGGSTYNLVAEQTITGNTQQTIYFTTDLPTDEQDWYVEVTNDEGTISSDSNRFTVTSDSSKEDVTIDLISISVSGANIEITFSSSSNVDADLYLGLFLSDSSTSFTGTIYAGQSFGVAYITAPTAVGTLFLNYISGGNDVTQTYFIGSNAINYSASGGGSVGSNVAFNALGLTCIDAGDSGIFTYYYNSADSKYYNNEYYSYEVGTIDVSYYNGTTCKYYKFVDSYLVDEG